VRRSEVGWLGGARPWMSDYGCVPAHRCVAASSSRTDGCLRRFQPPSLAEEAQEWLQRQGDGTLQRGFVAVPQKPAVNQPARLSTMRLPRSR
jgi:hypothetical protein